MGLESDGTDILGRGGRDARDLPPSPLSQRRHAWGGHSKKEKPGKQASPDTKPEVIPTLDLQLQSCEMIHCCYLGHPSAVFCYGRQSRLKPGVTPPPPPPARAAAELQDARQPWSTVSGRAQ